MPKGKKSKGGKRKRGKARGSTGATRELLHTTVPKSAIEVKGHAHGMRVVGSEIVSEIVSTLLPNRKVLTLSPIVSDTFPKLTGYALQWERYKFRRVSLRYVPACPATQSGAVGIAIHTSFLGSISQVTNDMPEFASYEYSRAGTVAGPLRTPEWRTVDPEWFFTTSEISNDPLKTNQGSIAWLTRDSSSADNGKLAGYLVIDYDIEFMNNRPTQNRVAVSRNSGSQNVTGTSGPNVLDLGEWTNTIGTWLKEPSKSGTATDQTRSVWGDLAAGTTEYLLDLVFDVGSSSVDSNSSKAQSYTLTADGKVVVRAPKCPTTPRYVSWHPALAKKRPGRLTHEEAKLLFDTPETAGDFKVYLSAVNDVTMNVVTLWTASYAPGTGATAVEAAIEFELGDNVLPGVDEGQAIQVFASVYPTGTETRAITDFFTSLVPIYGGFQ